MPSAFITGLAGPELTPDERAFVRDAAPAGLILFARNCLARDQIRRLVADFRAACRGDPVLVLIDQEGGRVQRIRPPIGRALPPAAAFAAEYGGPTPDAISAAMGVSRLVADDLKSLGIDTNCAPVLDVPIAGAHGVIGNRAYGTTPEVVAALGRATAEGLMAGGVVPVMKHVPGHGRAMVDSHLELPVVDASEDVLAVTDFAPFRALRDLPAAMTAHVLFTALDAESPASASATIISEVVRGRIGFDGLLMSDDVSMKALAGSIGARTHAVLDAGSDLALHCNGNLGEMQEVAAAAGPLGAAGMDRLARAMTILSRCDPYDRAAAEASLARVLSRVA